MASISNASYVGGAKYDQAAVARAMPEAATLTTRAQRVLSKAEEVESLAERLLTLVAPTADMEAKEGGPRPAPSHAVFALEEADQRLEVAVRTLNEAVRLL